MMDSIGYTIHLLTQFFKYLIVVVLAGYLGAGGGSSAAAVDQSHSAYAIRYGQKELAGIPYPAAYLDQISLISDEVVKSWPVAATYNSLAQLNDHQLVLCDTGGKFERGGAAIFDLQKKTIVHRLKLAGVNPSRALTLGNRLCLITEKHGFDDQLMHHWQCLEIFDRSSWQPLACLTFPEAEVVDELITPLPGQSQVVVASHRVTLQGYYPGWLARFRTDTATLEQQLSQIKQPGFFRGIATDLAGYVYLSATYPDYREHEKEEAQQRLNDRLYVYDSQSLKLQKTIPIGVLAEQLVYVPDNDCVYVGHASWDERVPQNLEVVSCSRETVVATIPVPGFRRMAYVGQHKLYVSCSGGPLLGANGQGQLLVIDVRNNKIIKQIPGEYAPIAYCAGE